MCVKKIVIKICGATNTYFTQYMCELNLRPSYGNKINIKTKNVENNFLNEFVFDVTRPWQKKYNKSREITMNNIVYNGGTYYAYIPDHIKEYYEISDDDLALGIFSDKFTLYLDNIQLKIECEVIDIYPVKFLIKYILKELIKMEYILYMIVCIKEKRIK